MCCVMYLEGRFTVKLSRAVLTAVNSHVVVIGEMSSIRFV